MFLEVDFGSGEDGRFCFGGGAHGVVMQPTHVPMEGRLVRRRCLERWRFGLSREGYVFSQ